MFFHNEPSASFTRTSIKNELQGVFDLLPDKTGPGISAGTMKNGYPSVVIVRSHHGCPRPIENEIFPSIDGVL